MTLRNMAPSEPPVFDNGMDLWSPSSDDLSAFASDMQAQGITLRQKENKGVSVEEFVESMARTASRKPLATEGIDVTDLPEANAEG